MKSRRLIQYNLFKLLDTHGRRVSFKNYILLYILKMVKKKAAKKSKKVKSVRRGSRSKSRLPSVNTKTVRASKRKIKIITANLFISAVIALIFFALWYNTETIWLYQTFGVLAIISGVFAATFLIVLLIFFALRLVEK